MSKAKEETMWTPLEKALDQARDFNDQAVQFARETADEVRSRSEAAIEEARKRSKRTLKLVRNNFDEAQKNFEKQTTEFEFGKLPEMVRTQLRSIEGEVRKAVVAVAKSFDIATTSEVDALRRKLSNLEKRVSELRRENAAA